MMELQYDSLDIRNYEIRLLTILPGEEGTPVRCTMRKASLLASQDYYALSYCWGDESVRSSAIVNNTEITVTANLAGALCRLRQLSVCTVCK